MEDNVRGIKYLNKIILAHKIYAWLLIILALVATIGVILGYSFGSLLVAYNFNDLGNTLNMYYYIGFIITFLFGIFNLIIVQKLKEKSHYSIHLSLTSVVFIFLLRNSYMDYIFAGAILLLWALYVKKVKYILYITPLVLIFGLYNIYTNNVDKSADEFISAVHHNATYDEIKIILEQGIDPNIQNEIGRTALFYAQSSNKAELLLEYGANPNHETIKKKTPLFSGMIKEKDIKTFFNTLIKGGADINHQDIDGDTVLHESVYWGRYVSVESLLENNASIFIKNNKGQTAIDVAIEQYKSQFTGNSISEYNLERAIKVLNLLSIDPKEIKTLNITGMKTS